MANYKLDIFLANGSRIEPYAERICEEIRAVFVDGMEARNPKKIIEGPCYSREKNAVEVTLYSQAELSSPGHMLGNVSKRLLQAEEKMTQEPEKQDTLRGQLVGGKRLFRIESCRVGKEEDAAEMSNYELLETIAFLVSILYEAKASEDGQEERDIPKRNQARKIIEALKKVVRENQFILEEIRGKEK